MDCENGNELNMNTILSHLARVLLLLSFYQHTTRAQTMRVASSNYTDHIFTCNATNPCSNATIYCPTNANCSVLCHDSESCKDSVIHCPTDADCNVLCNGSKSCQEAIIQCPSNGGCHISCDESYACNDAVIHWVDNEPNSIFCGVYDYACAGINFKPYNQTADFIQNCTRYATCYNATFHCPSDANCDIKCDGGDGCRFSAIHCPTNHGLCNVICTDAYMSCSSVSIYAQKASFFNFALIPASDSDQFSMMFLSIWFPPKVGNVPRARLDLDSTQSARYYQKQKYYALNGWQDVDVHIHEGSHDGTMYCNTGYEDSCAFDSSSQTTACISSNPICDDPIVLTPAPSFYPSSAPNSTPIPTRMPSFDPSSTPTLYPTQTPTMVPTSEPTTPTIYPTSAPTIVPTSEPTIYPTREPTIVPTSDPTVSPTLVTTYPTISAPKIAISTNYTILIIFLACDQGKDSCDLNKTSITSDVNDILVAYTDYDSTILSTNIINNEVTVILSVEMDEYNSLIGETISDRIKTELDDKYAGDIDVIVKETNEGDTEPTKENEMAFSTVIIYIIVAVIALVMAVAIIYYRRVHQRKRDDKYHDELECAVDAVDRAQNMNDRNMIQAQREKYTIEGDNMDNDEDSIEDLYIKKHQNTEETTTGNGTTITGNADTNHVTKMGDTVEGTHGFMGTISDQIKTEGDVPYERCTDCGKQDLGKIYDGDGVFYCNQCWMYYSIQLTAQN
eukprot:927602_1